MNHCQLLKTTLFNSILLLTFGSLSAESILFTDSLIKEHQNSGEKDNHEKTETVMFTPPEGWRLADKTLLSPSVKTMVVGKAKANSEFPPSINLGTETYSGTLKQYLKRIKEINNSQGAEWKDLGMIRTEAGDASLSQVDTKTQWGNVRMMHVILLKEGTAYILTAASLKEEFPNFYKDIFNSLRSLRFEKRMVAENIQSQDA